MCNLTTPHRFGGFAFRLLRNTEIKEIMGKFAHRSLLIRRRETRETKTRSKCKVKELKRGQCNQEKHKLMKENEEEETELKCRGGEMDGRGGGVDERAMGQQTRRRGV